MEQLKNLGKMIYMLIGYTLGAVLAIPLFKLIVLQDTSDMNQFDPKITAYIEGLAALWILTMISYAVTNFRSNEKS